MLKKLPSDKINGTENAFFFLSRALIHHSFTLICDSYMSWSTSFAPLKLCVGFSIFDSVLFLLKVIFLFSKMHKFFDFDVIIPFKIEIIEKPFTVLLPDLWFLRPDQQGVLKFNDICVRWSSPKLTWWQIF